jgi:DNA topoisomerase VI subunit B
MGLFERYMPELAESLSKLTGRPKEEIMAQLERRLDEEKG